MIPTGQGSFRVEDFVGNVLYQLSKVSSVKEEFLQLQELACNAILGVDNPSESSLMHLTVNNKWRYDLESVS